jgi:hypothetical protein
VGVETALLIAAGTAAVAGATGSVMAGNAANREAKNAANLERLNADIARQEAQEQARIRGEEMTKLKETQKLAMLKSGMGLAGSPLLILEDTKRQLALELNSLEYRNNVESYSSSLRQQNYLASGRSAMIGGYVKGVESLASFGVKALTPSTKTKGATV